MTRKPSVVGVVGLGAVGEALSGMLDAAGYAVVGVDRDLDVRHRVGLRAKERTAAAANERRAGAGWTLTGDLAQLAGAELVIEAVPDDLTAKIDVLRRLDVVCPPETVFVSTAAALPLPRLAIAAGRPQHTVGLRLLRPPVPGGAVAPVRTAMSTDEAYEAVEALVTDLGLVSSTIGAHPAELATDLVYAGLNRAVALVEEGLAPAESIDTAMRLGCGLPAGPLRLLDELGLDEVHTRLTALWARTGDDAFRPAPLLTARVSGGTLGRKTGEGFHRYGTAADRDRAAAPPAPPVPPVAWVGVVGSGTMARGIAQVCASAGIRTTLVARSEEKADRALGAVAASLAKSERRGRITAERKAATLALLAGADDLAALGDCDLVIEAAAEEVDVKRDLFGRLGALCRPGALLATTTSSLSVAECTAPADRSGDVLGLHFFNPAPVMKLVELVRTPTTGEAAMTTARAFCAQVGKVAVECPDRAGFLVNRLLFPYLADAVRLLDRYGVDVAELDAAVERGFGYPMGPYALLDGIGLDISLAILHRLHAEFPDGGYEPPSAVEELVAGGFLGRKSGQGFRRA